MPAAIALGGAFLGTTIFGSITVGGLLATTALSGAAYLLNRPKQPNSSGSIDQGQKVVSRQAVPTQRMIYGRSLVGGPLFFLEVKPPYLYYGIVLASHKIDGVEKMFIGNTDTPIDSAGFATSSPFWASGPYYVQVSYRDGDDDQLIDPILAADFPELESTFRQRGHATAVIKMYYGFDVEVHQRIWGNEAPAINFLVRGQKVFDPRDASQDQNDSTTWKWSDNSSLCTASWLTHKKGGRRSYDQVDLADLAKAANYDDEVVTLDDGFTQKRYTTNGVISLGEAPISVVQNLLAASLGRLVWKDGKYSLVSGVYRDPVWTVTDSSARGAVSMRYGTPRQNLLNVVRTRFTAPDREYQIADGPVFENAGYIAADGERHETTIELPFTSSHHAAQRIAKAIMEQSRLGKQVIRRENIEALRLSASDTVNIQSETFKNIDGTYQVQRIALTEQLEFEMEFEQVAPEIYDFNPSEYQPFTISPTELEGVN